MREKAMGKRLPAKETLRSNIRDYIQRQIAEGVYKPGDRIVETRLAKELDVSQAPVREAMLELATVGLLEDLLHLSQLLFRHALGSTLGRIFLNKSPDIKNILNLCHA